MVEQSSPMASETAWSPKVLSVVMTLVMLERQSTNEFQRMNEKIRATPEIVRAHRISGDFDYALETLAPDFDSYRVMIERFLEGDVAIKQYQSRIMQEVVKSTNDSSVVKIG